MSLNCPNCGVALGLRLAALSQGESLEPFAAPQQLVAAPQSASVAEERVVGSSLKAKRRKYVYEDEEFLLFWNAFPLRKGKAEAFRRWQQVRAAGVAAATIIDAARRYATWCAAHPDRYVKHAEGWLNGGRWDDELDMPAAVGATDPAYIVGTPEWDSRVEAEEQRVMQGVDA